MNFSGFKKMKFSGLREKKGLCDEFWWFAKDKI